MIPHSLQIKNFLSYGAQPETVHFDPYHLICLSGKNGHGKSALLDAMTWAIWGIARKTLTSVKPDQGLLRLGQNQMMVMFEFSCNGQRYRIRREFILNHGKPYAQLEFGVIDAQTEQFIPLTDKTIRTTQECIETTLRLDYESFTNSTFLRQGGSNEFSKKSAKDRKEILASILGLQLYDTIRKRALQKIKNAQSQKDTLNAFKQKIDAELANQPSVEQEYSTAQQQHKYLEQELHNFYQTVEICNQKVQQNALSLQKAAQLAKEEQELQKQYTQDQATLTNALVTWRMLKQHTRVQHNKEAALKDHAHMLTQVQEQQILLQQQLSDKQKLFDISEKIRKLEQTYTQKQQTLEQERAACQQEITILQQQIDQITAQHTQFTTQCRQLTEEISAYGLVEKALQQQEAQLEKRKAYYQQLIAKGNWFTHEAKELEQKITLTGQHSQSPSCPLCKQNLSAARRKFLKTDFEQEYHQVRHKLQRVTRIIPILKQLLLTQHETVQQLKKEEQAHTMRVHTLQTVEQQIEQLQRQQKELLKKQELFTQQYTQISAVPLSLITDDIDYKELVHAKSIVEQALQKNSYNQTMHETIIKKVHASQEIMHHIQQHTDAVAQKNKYEHDIQQLCASMKKMKAKLKQLISDQAAYAYAKHEKEILEKEKIQLQQQEKELVARKEQSVHTLAQLKATLNRLHVAHQEQQKILMQITELEIVIDDYQAIAQATSKDGIQALLIEEAIPEIEQEANLLLSKLTNNQAQIFIESLKDLKSGGTKETLDIKIADPAGIRPYEMFSGGEAFRIDFALRIAISKLLARRAGTALQTLIIDEGFGSQDEEGLAHIMDALYKIQDDFAKIIIVSHLPIMKDQFPVHFVVEKGPQGSRVSIIEQD